MKWSWFGRAALALTSAVSLGLSMTACGGGTVAYIWAPGVDALHNGQVVGYKVDRFTGNLTAVPGQPFSSNGANPVQVLVRPGGRFLYVINQGIGASATSAGTSAGIDVFAIGGEGTLTFEQHYDTLGHQHMWATFDSTGSFLFVLDKYNPSYQPDTTQASYDPNGSITTFASDAATGRLNLQLQQASTQPGAVSPSYLDVGQSPRRMVSTGACLFTLNDVGQTVSSYAIANGQLSTVTTGLYPVNSVSATSISGNATYIFITDNTNGVGPGNVYSYTVSNCSLVPFTQNAVIQNTPTAVNPNNVFLSNSSKYFYVLNGPNTNTSTTAAGSILSAYNIISGGQITEVTGAPFPAGVGPVCMVEDPTSQFLYTSNSGDGTITGYRYADTNGVLANLSRGSSFKTSTMNLGCLTSSGVI